MTALERFLKYVKIHTTSSERDDRTPTEPREFDLSRALEAEMKALGMERVCVDEHAYVYGAIPATPGCERLPCIGFIAHLDTSPDFPGVNVKPQLIENYDGGPVPLGESGRVLTEQINPQLPTLRGHTLVTTDGTTLLGADDKAGIAAILTACEELMASDRPHGAVAVCFPPDEEVGHGAALLDFDRFGADFAYTVDGGDLNEINYETFNAAAARWEIKGFSIHPGYAKDKMINAARVAMQIHALLPLSAVPEHTEGREGYIHLGEIKGNVEHAEMSFILRDHDAAGLAEKEKLMRLIEKQINERYGAGTAKLTIREQYRNMAEMLAGRMGVVKVVERAIRTLGLEPVSRPIRGGTDGAQLSFRGLFCPNIGTGAYCCHGPYEHTSAENLQNAARLVRTIIELVAAENRT